MRPCRHILIQNIISVFNIHLFIIAVQEFSNIHYWINQGQYSDNWQHIFIDFFSYVRIWVINLNIFMDHISVIEWELPELLSGLLINLSIHTFLLFEEIYVYVFINETIIIFKLSIYQCFSFNHHSSTIQYNTLIESPIKIGILTTYSFINNMLKSMTLRII